MKPLFLSGLLAALTLTACATTPKNPLVLARADNSYETIGQGKTRTQALSQALDNARSTCRSQQPIIQNEQTRYQGVISEQTGRVIEQVGTVVGAITGQRDLGGRLARDDDYEVTLKFTCR